MNARNVFRLIAVFCACLAVCGAGGAFASAALPPAQGVAVPALAAFDKTMQEFMAANGISAGELAVMRHGRVVLNRAYGWQDREHTKPLPPDALMRVASVTKPFTAAAVRKLISQGKLSLTNRVFNLGQPGGGILDFEPLGTPDPRLKEVTIQHCLRHRGGWDRSIAGDLSYFEIKAAKALNVASPPGREGMVRYIMGQPLQHNPGAKEAYSNIGFLLLGLVIEKVSGQEYLAFVRANVARPAGIADADLQLGRSLRRSAHAREPFYDDLRMLSNVFYPNQSDEAQVPAPYGSFDMEARTSQGRIITTAHSLVLFLDKFMVYGEDIGKPRWPAGNWQYHHSGLQSGSEAVACARGDGINYAVIFNKANRSGSTYSAQIHSAFDKIIDEGSIKAWPAK